MKKISNMLPDVISFEEMLSVRGGLGLKTNVEDPDDIIVIECKPGPAVSCHPGNAVGK